MKRVLLFLPFISLLYADQPASPLEVTAAAESFYEGQGFELRVTALAAQPPHAPELLPSPDFFVHFIGETIASQSKDTLYLYRYRLIPRREGVLTLPPVHITLGGQLHTSEPEAIRVLTANSSDDLRLDVALDRTECVAGQALVLTCTWYTGLPLSSIRALDISAPILSDPAWRVLIPESERGLSGKDTIGLPVEGQRIIARVRPCILDTRPFKAITFKRLLIPLRHGTLRLPAVRLLCSHIPGNPTRTNAYPSYFDNDFFHAVGANQKYQRLGARSSPIELSVSPLPEQNRPLNFSGIIGPCALTLTVEENQVMLGDPLEVTLTLEGHPHPESLTLPPLQQIADFATDFVVPDEIGRGRIVRAARVWRFLAVPRRTAVTQLPGIALSIFEPGEQAYRTIRSNPAPIVVLPDGDRHMLARSNQESPRRERNEAGLWHNLRPQDAGWHAHAARFLLQSLPLWLLAPVLAFLLGRRPARLARLRRSDPAAARRATALPEFLSALKRLTPQAKSQLRTAVSTYFSAYLGGRPGALTYLDIERGLDDRGIVASHALRTLLRQIYHDADIARFGPGSKPDECPLSFRTLRTELKRLDQEWS